MNYSNQVKSLNVFKKIIMLLNNKILFRIYQSNELVNNINSDGVNVDLMLLEYIYKYTELFLIEINGYLKSMKINNKKIYNIVKNIQNIHNNKVLCNLYRKKNNLNKNELNLYYRLLNNLKNQLYMLNTSCITNYNKRKHILY